MLRYVKSIGPLLARILRLALLLIMFGWPAWFVVSSALQHNLAFDLPILGAAGIASVTVWLSFPRAPAVLIWSLFVGIGASTVGILVLVTAHLNLPAIAAGFILFCVVATQPLVRIIWSLRGLTLQEQMQILREASTMPVLARQFLLWELRHAPFEDRLKVLHVAATRTTEPTEASENADDDEDPEDAGLSPDE